MSDWLTGQTAAVEKILDAIDIFKTAVHGYDIADIQLGIPSRYDGLTGPFYGNHIYGIRQRQILDQGTVTGIFLFQDKLGKTVFLRLSQFNLMFNYMPSLFADHADIIGAEDIASADDTTECFGAVS
jgi:hypothetical protein